MSIVLAPSLDDPEGDAITFNAFRLAGGLQVVGDALVGTRY